MTEILSQPPSPDLLISRRTAIKIGLAVTAALCFTPGLALAQEGLQIIENPDVKWANSLLSLPWLPLSSSVYGNIESTGLNEGGAWDKFDELDRIINGRMARSAYWRPTRDWLTEVAVNALNAGASPRSSGYCLDAAFGSRFGSMIKGDIEVLGIPFSLRERYVIGALACAGLDRDEYNEVNEQVMSDVSARFVDLGEAVFADHSPVAGDEWWGVVREIEPNGMVTITRYQDYGRTDLRTLRVHYSTLRGFKVVSNNPETGLPELNKAHPKYTGNFAIINKIETPGGQPTRRVGGLVIGTHILKVA